MLQSVIGFAAAVWGVLLLHRAFTTNIPELEQPPIYRALREPYNFRVIGGVILAAVMVILGLYLLITGLRKKWFYER